MKKTKYTKEEFEEILAREKKYRAWNPNKEPFNEMQLILKLIWGEK